MTTGVAMHSNEANLQVLLQCWKRKMRLHRQFHQSHLMVARPLWFQRESESDIYHTCLSFIFLIFFLSYFRPLTIFLKAFLLLHDVLLSNWIIYIFVKRQTSFISKVTVWAPRQTHSPDRQFLDLQLKMSRVRISAVSLSRNNFWQDVHTCLCHQAV